MSDTPTFDALLMQLCGLSAEDMQLPLPVVINLHRARLQAPLRGLGRYVDELRERHYRMGGVGALERLAKEFGVSGETLENDEQTWALYEKTEDNTWDAATYDPTLTEMERALLRSALGGWVAYDPVALLFVLAHRGVSVAFLPELIEAELVAMPAAYTMVMRLAELDD